MTWARDALAAIPAGPRLLSLVAIIALALLTACDCVRIAEGVVSDAGTGTPLPGVQCSVTDKGWDTDVTNTAGQYRVKRHAGSGLDGHCGDIEVEFSTSGYRSARHTNPGNVSLEKL